MTEQADENNENIIKKKRYRSKQTTKNQLNLALVW